MNEYKKVLNGYGVLFALYVAKESCKNPSEIIDLLNKVTESNNPYKEYSYEQDLHNY